MRPTDRMLRLGPIQLESWHLIALGLGLAALLWIVRAAMVRVSGSWERVDEGRPEGPPEVIQLVQFGPFVRGQRVTPGGFQEYTGLLRGRTIFMTRRDHGAAFITGQGFPAPLVPELEGTVTARLRLTVSADGQAIFGAFTPQKIEFTRRPPKITRRAFQASSYRRYARLPAPPKPEGG